MVGWRGLEKANGIFGEMGHGSKWPCVRGTGVSAIQKQAVGMKMGMLVGMPETYGPL